MTLDDSRARLRAIYDPDRFRRDAETVARLLGDYLRFSQADARPAEWKDPEERIALARRLLERQGPADLESLVATFLEHTHRLHSPRYMGHQVAVPIPLAGAFESLGAVANQGGAIYEMSPISTAAERVMVETLGGLIGWAPGGYDGFATHGGSLANLTALTTARNFRYPDFWERGETGGKRPAILVSADSHYSIARAAGMLGIGSRQVLKVALDEKRRMRASAAEKVLRQAKADGLDVFALVAASGSTPVGAFDPLDELADLSEREGIWLHADGCHGASVLVSKTHRGLAKGIARADSVAWDAHKMLFVPALSTYLFYRDRTQSFSTFSQDAPYLFDPEAPGLSAYDGAIRTFECTKRSLAIGLWAAWAIHGPRLFEDLIDVTIGLGKRFHEILTEAPDFEPAHEPECNIVCFRHLPSALKNAPREKVSAFQQALRRKLVEDGSFYTTSTRLDGEMVLRVTLMNPLTDDGHLYGLLQTLRALGRGLVGTAV